MGDLNSDITAAMLVLAVIFAITVIAPVGVALYLALRSQARQASPP